MQNTDLPKTNEPAIPTTPQQLATPPLPPQIIKKNVAVQVAPRQVSYKDICEEIDATYLHTHTNNSNIVDIIGIYVKGQKILYTESKTICELRLSYLMLPSIFFTVSCSIINLIVITEYGKPITSILNGTIAFILAMINYLKLDARAEAHRVSAYKYDKLLSYIEFQSGKQLFLLDANLEINEIISKIEAEIKEIKETNPFVLPELIRYKFPFLTSVNVFTEVKKIENEEMVIKNKLTNITRMIMANEATLIGANDTDICDILSKNDALIAERMALVQTIIELQKKYVSIDEVFNEEIQQYFNRNKWGLSLCDWLKV